jgi:hypothetical protein
MSTWLDTLSATHGIPPDSHRRTDFTAEYVYWRYPELEMGIAITHYHAERPFWHTRIWFHRTHLYMETDHAPSDLQVTALIQLCGLTP